MAEGTCSNCGAQLAPREIEELFSALPEAERSRIARAAGARRGPLPRAGFFSELPDGTVEFSAEPEAPPSPE